MGSIWKDWLGPVWLSLQHFFFCALGVVADISHINTAAKVSYNESSIYCVHAVKI